jgi:hypothetical protein
MLLGARQANIRTRTADGKTARVLSARDDDSRIAYFAPVWLTDDRFLVSRVPLEPESVNDAGLYLARVGSEELTLVMPGRITAAAIDAGELLVQRGTDLIAQPFDAGTATLSGTARTLATGVRAFSAAGGTVVWWSPASQLMTVTRLARFSRNGERLPHIGPPAIYRDPAVSDDGRRVAVARADDHGQFEIWSYDLVSGVETRVSPFGVVAPVWAPDGQSVASGSGRPGRLPTGPPTANGWWAGPPRRPPGSSPGRWTGRPGCLSRPAPAARWGRCSIGVDDGWPSAPPTPVRCGCSSPSSRDAAPGFPSVRGQARGRGGAATAAKSSI